MGNLLDQLQQNAEKAKVENKELEKRRDDLIEVLHKAEREIDDLTGKKTKH
jgi:hypothetical protein